MNKAKEGKKFVYPESFMNALSYARVYFGLPFRQTQGMIKSHAKQIPGVPDYSTINQRVNKLDIKISQKAGDDMLSLQLTVQASGSQIEVNG